MEPLMTFDEWVSDTWNHGEPKILPWPVEAKRRELYEEYRHEWLNRLAERVEKSSMIQRIF